MKNDNEDGGFEAIEVSPTFFGSSGGVGLVEEDKGDIEQLPQQDDESTMNDESTIAAASSYISRGYSYVASHKKWVFVVMAATFVVFFSIGIGLGYPIGNIIYGNDDASSVSSAMAVDFTPSDHGDKSDGGAKSGKSKSDKSSGVSCVEYVHRFCAYDMNQPPFRCKTTTNQQSVYVVLILPSNIGKSRKGYGPKSKPMPIAFNCRYLFSS